MRKRITLALILAVLLILIGVLVNPVIVPRSWADAPLKFPLSIDTNAGLAIPSFDGTSIHNANNNAARLLVESNTVVYCVNDFVPDAIYDSDDSADASEADAPDLGLLQLAVTVPTKLPFIIGPSDNSGWIYNFADNATDNQADSGDAAHPDEGGFSAGAGAGPGGGAPSGGSEKKGTPKTPPKETVPGLSDDGGFGYIYGSLYYIAGLPGITPHNPAGTNGDPAVWLGDPPPIHTFGTAPQNNGDPDTPHGNDPPESGGNGDSHHYNRDHHTGGTTSQTGQTPTFSLTDAPSPPLTPTPEPATFSILGVGLVAMGLIRRRFTKLQ